MPRRGTERSLREYAVIGERECALRNSRRKSSIFTARSLSLKRGARPARESSALTVGRRRKGMSAAARAEVSARMKKYWAARRKKEH